MRIWLVASLALLLTAAPLAAQGLQDRLTDLFIFGEGDEALFLGGSAAADNPGIQVHGDHFVPSAVEGNATIIGFLTGSISTNLANLPVGASSGGETFRFEGGGPGPHQHLGGPDLRRAGADAGPGPALRRAGAHRAPLRDLARHPARRRATHLRA